MARFMTFMLDEEEEDDGSGNDSDPTPEEVREFCGGHSTTPPKRTICAHRCYDYHAS